MESYFEFVSQINQEQMLVSDGCSFNAPKNKGITQVISSIETNEILGKILGNKNVRTCITFTGKKDFFVKEKKTTDFDYPILEGSKGVPHRYSKIFYDNYVSYDLELRDKLNQEYKELAELENKKSPKVIGLADLERFKSPKIFIRLSDTRVTATYSDEVLCADLSLYMVTLDSLKDENEATNLYFLLGIFNSKLITFYFIQKGFIRNLNTGTPQIRLKDLRLMPVNIPEVLTQEELSFVVQGMMQKSNIFDEIKGKFSERLMVNYSLEKVSKKLEKFWELSFGELVLELSKKGAKLSLDQQDELEPYFEKHKTQLLELQKQINETDQQIDQLVYKLYGLTEDEIAIVENS